MKFREPRLAATRQRSAGVIPHRARPRSADASRLNALRRSGISLLEVVLALAIFLFSLAAISQLIHFGSLRALDIHYQHKAQMLCQTKLAELQAGIEPMQPTGFTPFSHDPDWEWRIDASQAEVANLWDVTVAVRGLGREDEISVAQWVLDPSKRGSTLDKPGGTQ